MEDIFSKLDRIEGDGGIQNMIAQANARYILFNTSEEKDNFPRYTIKDAQLDILAFYYLNLGCSLFENNELDASRIPIEKGASVLEYVHASSSNKKGLSNYFSLIAALSYYVTFHYSKAYILTSKVDSSTPISQLIHYFLRRDYIALSKSISEILVDESYTDDFIARKSDEIIGDTKIYEITIAKSLDGFVKYLQSGEEQLLINSKEQLRAIKEIAEIKGDPGVWWVIRLLLLILEGLKEASLWNVLKNYFTVTESKVKTYIQSLVYQHPNGIYELFITQRNSLTKVLNPSNSGCIVSIPTSSGKTRIAEIAILNTCLDSNNKVLYIAPFRSLAFEIESSLERVLINSGISVSHLYGGNLYSPLDEKIIDDSNVIIATPEKAKAILRGSPGIMEQVKLIILDEGHLLGPDKRLIGNEIFVEELRYYSNKNNCKFLLLSAVLPNAEEFSRWLTDSRGNVYSDKWRPSDERLGILEWTGEVVNLNWKSNDTERASFNNKFIKRVELPLVGRQRKVRYLPGDGNEAVAATAYKLRLFGTVLIFVGRKNSVFTMARAYYKFLEDSSTDFNWENAQNWKAFVLACTETYGEDNEWLMYAKKGILCHNGDLHADVRLPLERLMRNDKPLVIISTSTLGQGVNLGISSVIFSTIYQSRTQITSRDFWNIAGRAGRAFVDHEGKILVALDTTNKNPREIRWHRSEIQKYFNKEQIDLAQSGVLVTIKRLYEISVTHSIPFDTFLQLISENKVKDIGEEALAIDETLDWIDDTLLSLHSLYNENSEDIDYSWVEAFFRKSLAFIQITDKSVVTGTQFLDIIKNRVEGIVSKVGTDKRKWLSLIKSGIPLNSDLMIENKLVSIIDTIITFTSLDNDINNKIDLLKILETILIDIPVLKEDNIESNAIDEIRTLWLSGAKISGILSYENALDLITKIYTFKLPWVLNGIAKKLRNLEMEDEAEVVEEISTLLEAGLPNLVAVKIYQAGIRSRSSATELSAFFENETWEKSIQDYKQEIVANKGFYAEKVSPLCNEWIELLINNTSIRKRFVKLVPDFTFSDIHEKTNKLLAKKINNQQYLMSPDYKVIENIEGTEIDFSSVNDIPGIYFQYDKNDKLWHMTIDNPYVVTFN